jgi:23S rRNA (pseudouridine1915-N3)-methyltransferase
MKIDLWWIGKTKPPYLETGIADYAKRISHYANFSLSTLPDVKNAANLHPDILKKKEADLVLSRLEPDIFLILLDENGKNYDSAGFAAYMEDLMIRSVKKIVFLIGGAYGFDESLYARANGKISLSRLTFSHQMVRLFFTEQLYRAFTIINNEKYHNT